METLASQYYAQIGIGGMARPMVVGDRLWLFSQTPSGPAPVQSMMLNHSGPTPMPIPPLRGYPPSTTNAPIMDSARNALLSRGQPLNYGISKSMNAYPLQSPFLNRLPPHFKPYNTYQTNKYHQETRSAQYIEKPLHFNKYDGQNSHFCGGGPLIRSSLDHQSDNYLPIKYDHLSNMMKMDQTSSTNMESTTLSTSLLPPPTTGITELERAFGDRNLTLLKNKSEIEIGDSGLRNRKVACVLEESDASSSDIDCEEIEENTL